jgi:hypothetical protein
MTPSISPSMVPSITPIFQHLAFVLIKWKIDIETACCIRIIIIKEAEEIYVYFILNRSYIILLIILHLLAYQHCFALFLRLGVTRINSPSSLPLSCGLMAILCSL